jgi:hypothetical protein
MSWATRSPTSASCSIGPASGFANRRYFNYVNRLVLATGLTVEPEFEQTCRPTFDAG